MGRFFLEQLPGSNELPFHNVISIPRLFAQKVKSKPSFFMDWVCCIHFTKIYYKILPMINEWGEDNLRIKKGKKVQEGFVYSSDNNKEWMTKTELKKWIDINKNYIGRF